MFSRRTDVERAHNRVAEAVERARNAGRTLLDLTLSNPTRAGLPYDEDAIRKALAPREALSYAPHPFGLPEARRAVAAHAATPPERTLLTASTSEAYGFLLKLLCDPGDEVLVPQPSYPLLEHLARLEAVRVRPYPLRYDGEWHVDAAQLRAQVTSRTRAVLVVSPNNPTGSYAKLEDLHAIGSLGLPVVSDEVFASYPLDASPPPDLPRSLPDVLTFTLGGLSKECGLPQVKLGWILVDGPDGSVREALGRLELVADTYLSVSAMAQVCSAELLQAGARTREAIRRRIRRNLARLRDAIGPESPADVLRAEGGWSAVLRVPRTLDEESWVMRALHHGVLVHPGWFYDFPEEAYLVLSLLPEEGTFDEGIRRLAACVATHQ